MFKQPHFYRVRTAADLFESSLAHICLTETMSGRDYELVVDLKTFRVFFNKIIVLIDTNQTPATLPIIFFAKN